LIQKETQIAQIPQNQSTQMESEKSRAVAPFICVHLNLSQLRNLRSLLRAETEPMSPRRQAHDWASDTTT